MVSEAQYSGETVHFRIKGKKELLFHGIPFAISGRLTFRCHQGIFIKRTDKEVQRDEKVGLGFTVLVYCKRLTVAKRSRLQEEKVLGSIFKTNIFYFIQLFFYDIKDCASCHTESR